MSEFFDKYPMCDPRKDPDFRDCRMALLNVMAERDNLIRRVEELEARWDIEYKEDLQSVKEFSTMKAERDLAVKALESIAKNSCCEPCREAGRVATEALKQIREE